MAWLLSLVWMNRAPWHVPLLRRLSVTLHLACLYHAGIPCDVLSMLVIAQVLPFWREMGGHDCNHQPQLHGHPGVLISADKVGLVPHWIHTSNVCEYSHVQGACSGVVSTCGDCALAS